MIAPQAEGDMVTASGVPKQEMWSKRERTIDACASMPLWQQDLKRCRLRTVPYCVSVVFFLLSILYAYFFCYFGFLTKRASLKKISVEYGEKCGDELSCLVDFDVPYEMTEPTLFYRLEGLVPNRRDIANSYSTRMLRGDYVSTEEMLASCAPVVYYDDRPAENNILIPCGLFAHNVFTDSFSVIDSSGEKVNFSEEGISLVVDRTQMFHDPAPEYSNGSHWLATSGIFQGGQRNEHFIVWMRRGTFSPFRKVYGLMESGTLKPGHYVMSIRNFYNVPNVRKFFVISEWTKGVIGGSAAAAMGVFGTMSVFLLFGACVLGWLGYRRTLPSSPYNPINLRDISEDNEELLEVMGAQ